MITPVAAKQAVRTVNEPRKGPIFSFACAILIGAVLLEAIILYGVYGVVEDVLGQRVVNRLRTT